MDWLNIIVVIAAIIGALYIFVAQAKEGMRELKEEIRDVRTDLDRVATKLEKKIDHLDQKLDAKRDKLEADIALVRKDVNRNTGHLFVSNGKTSRESH